MTLPNSIIYSMFFVYFKCNEIKRYKNNIKKNAAHMPHTEKREMSDTLLRH